MATKQAVKKVGKNENKDEEKDKLRRRIMMIVIIILIILSLITSCSCTSNFFGRIGELFRNEGDHPITGEDNDPENIKNKYLKFDTDKMEISLSDSKAKLSFSYRNINPKEFTCTTSDASIATCYVENGYVVINPKSAGTVTVTLKTTANGKSYEATATVTITDPNKYIKLSSTKGTINMAYTKYKSVNYSLVGITGDVTVNISDESIAKAVVKNGVLKITAIKTGKTEITVSINYNGIEYKDTYYLTVINEKNPSKPSKPDDSGQTKPEKLDDNNRLKELSMPWTDLHFDPETLEYRVGVKWRNKVSLKAIPESSKATVSYTFNGKTVSDLKDLELKLGDNIVAITVTAEDGSTRTYKVIINKVKNDNNYLKSLTTSEGTLTPKFNKNQLSYQVDVTADVNTIDLTAIPKSKKATLTYTFNGKKVSSLDNLKLRTGPNSVRITVTAEDGSTRTYQVIINKDSKGEVDRNSLLESLTDSLGKIDFDPYVTDYNIGVKSDVDNISLSAIPSSKDATIKYTYNGKEVTDLSDLDLLPGDNKVIITVTAKDGQTKTEYTVTINKELADNSSSLMDLKVLCNDGKLNPTFEENVLFYEVKVNETVDKISLEATPNSNAKSISYTLNGKTVNDLFDLPLHYGDNTVTITVTGSDGTKRTYKVVITRISDKSSDASIKDITVDGESILSTFDKTVDNDTDSVILVATPNDPNATVTYYYEGKEYKDLDELKVDLKTGANVVQVVITAEDGITKNTYDVTINKKDVEPPAPSEDATLKDLIVNNESVLGSLNATIGTDSKINIVATPNSDKATIKYIYEGKEYTLTELENKLNADLKPGEKAEVTIRVTAEDGTTQKDYDLTINRDKEVSEVDNNFLDNLEDKDKKYDLYPIFDKNTNNYTMTVNYKETSISLVATPNPDAKSVTYTYKSANGTEKTVNSLNDLKLEDGKNVVTITVTSATGEKNVYTVTIIKPVRTIELDKSTYECNIELGTCTIEYIVKDDGNPTTDYDFEQDITIDGLPKGVTASKTEAGKIVLTIDPNVVTANSAANISLGIEGYKDNLANATVKFTSNAHLITSGSYEYDMSYEGSSGDNTRSIILKTDVLIGDVKVVVKDGNGNVVYPTDANPNPKGKHIEICTGNNCVKVNANGPINIAYTGEKTGPTSLPFEITATGPTTPGNPATITVDGSTAYGKEIGFPNGIDAIKINITEKYIVLIKANGGMFNQFTDEYEFKISSLEEIDLGAYDEPYKLNDKDKCESYKFVGYSKDESTSPDGPFDYNRTDNRIIKNLTENLTLYAIYTSESSKIDPITNTMWVVDVPLFHNEEYYKQYNKDKIIYPGATGKYTMNITNKSKDTITLTGMTLIEDKTVCIKNADGSYMGCLNMGYIIKDSSNAYHFHNMQNYQILNSYNKTVKDWPNDYNELTFDFESDESTRTLLPESEDRDKSWTEITIHWKWIDYEDGHTDRLDTLIGNKAAEMEDNDLLYSLKVGIHYTTDNSCQLD